MPNLKSAFKAIRQDKKRRERNQKVATELKSLAKKFVMALAAKKIDEAKKLGVALVSKLDKARSKGMLHRNFVSPSRRFILVEARAGYATDLRVLDVERGTTCGAGGLLGGGGFIPHSTVLVGFAGP